MCPRRMPISSADVASLFMALLIAAPLLLMLLECGHPPRRRAAAGSGKLAARARAHRGERVRRNSDKRGLTTTSTNPQNISGLKRPTPLLLNKLVNIFSCLVSPGACPGLYIPSRQPSDEKSKESY